MEKWEGEREREREGGEGGREINSTNMWESYIHNILDFSLSRTYFYACMSGLHILTIPLPLNFLQNNQHSLIFVQHSPLSLD